MKKDQQIAEVIEKIVKAGEKYNSSLQRIGELLDDLAEWIDKVLPEELGHVEFKHGSILFRRWKPCSNIGCLGPAFWWDDDEEYGLVSTDRTPGEGFYLHGDFNCHIRVAGRRARRKAAQEILEWLEAFGSFLERLASKSEEAVSPLEGIVKSLKEANETEN